MKYKCDLQDEDGKMNRKKRKSRRSEIYITNKELSKKKNKKHKGE